MQEISSLQNEKIKYLKSLQQKKYRALHGCYLLEGRRLVSEAALRGAEILSVAVLRGREEDFASILRDTKGAEQFAVSEQVLRALTLTESPEGIVACVKMREQSDALPQGKLILLLDGLQDPGNLGTVLRTANACGTAEVFLSKNCVDLYNPKAVRSAMGALFGVQVRQDCDFSALIPRLKAQGYAVLGTSLAGSNYYDANIQAPKAALVIGNEGNGVSQAVLDLCDTLVKLPISESAESLNAAMAAGILLYDLTYRKGLSEANANEERVF